MRKDGKMAEEQEEEKRLDPRTAGFILMLMGGVLVMVGLNAPIVIGGVMTGAGYWVYKKL